MLDVNDSQPLDLAQVGGLARFHDICLGRTPSPHPLVCRPKGFGLIWSAKSACTMCVLWYLNHAGLLEDAAAYHEWPHKYRHDVLLQSSAYLADAEDLDPQDIAFVRIIRDPYKRAVSTFAAAFDSEDPIATIVQARFGPRASFRQFLETLADVGPDIDAHTQPQRNLIENHVVPLSCINIDREDLFSGLNRFERLVGLKPTDFQAGFLAREMKRISRWHHAKRFPTREDWSEAPLGKGGVDGVWPDYEAFLTPRTRSLIERLYAVDFAAYRLFL